MLRIIWPDGRGWASLLGGLGAGAGLVIAYFRIVTMDESWMALALVAIAVLLAGIPYQQGPGRAHVVASLAPWRYFVLGLGLAMSVGGLVGAW